MRGRWGYTRATWPKERLKAEVAEIRAAPLMGRIANVIPVGKDASEVAMKLAERAAEAERHRR